MVFVITIDNTNSTTNTNVEQVIQLQLMTKILKEAVGDSDSFSIMLESITKAMNDNNGIGNGNSSVPYVNEIKNDIKSGNSTIEEAVDNASKKYGIDKDFLMAVIKQESSFDPKATSKSGAMGLMQLMPGTADDLGVTNAYDIGENVDGGSKYLRGLLDMYSGSKELALSAYNAGSNTVSSRGVKSKDDIYKMPAETKDYVSKIMKYYGK